MKNNTIVIVSAILLALILSIVFTPKVKAEEIDLNIIAQIESNNNPNAYNYKSGARGLYQITEICLRDFNELNGGYNQVKNGQPYNAVMPIINKITLEQLYLPYYNKIVADWYLNTRIPQMLKAYHLPDTVEYRLWAYNAGIGLCKKGIKPRETKNYIKKYKRLLKYSV